MNATEGGKETANQLVIVQQDAELASTFRPEDINDIAEVELAKAIKHFSVELDLDEWPEAVSAWLAAPGGFLPDPPFDVLGETADRSSAANRWLAS